MAVPIGELIAGDWVKTKVGTSAATYRGLIAGMAPDSDVVVYFKGEMGFRSIAPDQMVEHLQGDFERDFALPQAFPGEHLQGDRERDSSCEWDRFPGAEGIDARVRQAGGCWVFYLQYNDQVVWWDSCNRYTNHNSWAKLSEDLTTLEWFKDDGRTEPEVFDVNELLVAKGFPGFDVLQMGKTVLSVIEVSAQGSQLNVQFATMGGETSFKGMELHVKVTGSEPTWSQVIEKLTETCQISSYFFKFVDQEGEVLKPDNKVVAN